LTIFQNGFNPIWEETAEFKIVYPDLAFLEFRVKSGDYSKTDDHLGSFIAPFSSLRQGYRHVPLENYAGIKLTPASLFTHICVMCAVPNKNKV
jgi:phosphatidylinositol phospholipase C delta